MEISHYDKEIKLKKREYYWRDDLDNSGYTILYFNVKISNNRKKGNCI